MFHMQKWGTFRSSKNAERIDEQTGTI